MSEKLKSFPEGESNSDISQEEKENLDVAIDGYLAERTGPFTEVIDGDIDDILARYIEKGPELSPNVKASLRKAIRRKLGIKLRKDE